MPTVARSSTPRAGDRASIRPDVPGRSPVRGSGGGRESVTIGACALPADQASFHQDALSVEFHQHKESINMAGQSVKDEPLFDLAQDRVSPIGTRTAEALGLEVQKQVAQFRVRATWRVLDPTFGELRLSLKDPLAEKWMPLSGAPLLVARRFSGKDGTREAPEVTAVAYLRKTLGRDRDVKVLRLSGQEERVGDGVTDWRYWACISAPLTVALLRNDDGSVALVGV
ncbi:hypothetical protein SEA_JENOS_64 [Microbacterium phage Jenos]|nr:hypothetical protein SEA_JENOS_64 [Microbacterium phage Jenos]